MDSKEICNKLKEVRQQVADANNIPLASIPCNFEGECQGTCPKCEEELKYISDALEQKRQAGEEVIITPVEVEDGSEIEGMEEVVITVVGDEFYEEKLGGYVEVNGLMPFEEPVNEDISTPDDIIIDDYLNDKEVVSKEDFKI